MSETQNKPTSQPESQPNKDVETTKATRETQSQLQGAETNAATTQARENMQKVLPFETANVLSGVKHSYEYIKNTSLSRDIVTATKDMPEYKNLSDEQRVEKFSDNIDKIWFLALDTIIDNPDISQAEIRNMASGTSIAFMNWYNNSDANTKKTLDDFLKYGIGQAPTETSDKKSFLNGLGGIFGSLFRGFGANANFKTFINKNMLVAKNIDKLGKASFLSSPEVYSNMLSGVFGKNITNENDILDYIEKNFYDKKLASEQILKISTDEQVKIKLVMEQTGNNMTPEMLQRLNGLGKYFQVVESGKNSIKNILGKSAILDSFVGNLYAISTGQPLNGPLAWISNSPMGQEIMNSLKPIAGVAMPLMNYVFKFLGYKSDIPAGTNPQEWAKTHPFGSVEAFLTDRNNNYLLTAEARDRVATGLTQSLTGAESSLRTGTIFSDPSNLVGKLDSDFVLALNRKLNIDFSDPTKTPAQVLQFFSETGKFSELKKSIPEGYLRNDENSNLYDLKKISLLTKWYFMDWDKTKTFEEFVKSKQQSVDPKNFSDDPEAKKPVETKPYSLDGTETDNEDNASVASSVNTDQDQNALNNSEPVDTPETDGLVGEKLVLNGETLISNAKKFLSKPNGIVKNMIGHNFISSKNINTGVYEQCVRYAAFRTGYNKPLGNGDKVAGNLIKNYPSSFEDVSKNWNKITPGSVLSGNFGGVPHVCIVEQVDLKNKRILTTGMNEGIRNYDSKTSRSDMAGIVRVQWRSFDSLNNVNGLTIAKPKNNSSYMKKFVQTGKELGLLEKDSSDQDSITLPTNVSQSGENLNSNQKFENMLKGEGKEFAKYKAAIVTWCSRLNIPPQVLLKLFVMEGSHGSLTAGPGNGQSAVGLGQINNGTWNDIVNKYSKNYPSTKNFKFVRGANAQSQIVASSVYLRYIYDNYSNKNWENATVLYHTGPGGLNLTPAQVNQNLSKNPQIKQKFIRNPKNTMAQDYIIAAKKYYGIEGLI